MADLSDIDPDLNMALLNSDCKYLLESEVHKFLANSDDNVASITHNMIRRGDFTLLYLNCRSLNKNFDSLLHLLSVINFNVTAIALTETWLSNDTEHVYKLTGYNFICLSRSGKRGGGVAFFIKNTLNYKLLSKFSFINDCLEALFVDITLSSKASLILGCIYRPPNSNLSDFNNMIWHNLSQINPGKKPAIITGDFNIDLLRFDARY